MAGGTVRGDETQSALAKEGPRHAAPRKSLLNRIQGPAGKAMALAAMPTAVFVGMGLTPKIALADEKDIPFAPGPCVTRSDEPTPEATATAKPTESAKPTATPSATATATPSATATTGPTATASATASADPTATATATPTPTATETGQATTQQNREAAPTATPSVTATPTPTKSTNPLDPLGVGDALKDLFDGPDPKPTATTAAPTTAPTTSAPVQKPATADEPTAPADEPTATAPAEPKPETTADAVADKAEDKAGETAEDTAADTAADATKKAIEKAADEAGAKVQELPESAKGLDPKKDESIPDGAKPRFPCPEPDPEALAAAELEPGIPLLPDDPWRLESTLLTLKGLKYHGIVEVKTGSGKIKKVLKFTATGIDIKDLHQLTVHSEGLTGHVRSDKGSTSTITDGTVTMYTEELKGNLFGLIPITFSPESPPPLDVPFAFFTQVKLKQAGQFGGTLKVPGLLNTVEPN
ncbi:hypothetical protein AB0E66_05250 [Streptomyces sp. NPDC033753]|uniref:hypothetical protein n=1 Tax=Streptomyces sp. NPDC033753 TaxID=3155128 RepID=UPI0033FEFBFE